MKLTYNDAQHAYYLDGKRCKSITTVAKIPDDTYSLDQWRKRQVLIGVAVKPDLIEQAAAHFDDKERLNAIAEEAMTAARSHDAANRGTAMHRITERIDLDLGIIETPLSLAVREAWLRALEIAGLEIVPDLVERIVVYPERRICGRFDRIVRRKADGAHVVLDLKTGEGAVKYPHSIATQLGLYANAPLMAGNLPAAGGTTEEFGPLPDMDRSVGYIVHMPTPEQVEIVGVNLEAGWEAASSLCFGTLDWRARRDLIFPIAEVPIKEGNENATAVDHVGGDGVPAGEDSKPRKRRAKATPASEPAEVSGQTDDNGNGEHGAGDAKPSGSRAAGEGDSGGADTSKQARKKARLELERAGTDENHAVDPETRFNWLRARLQAIVDAGHGPDVAARWPAGTPKLKTLQHDDAGLDRITELLDKVEAAHEMPIGPTLRSFLDGDPEPEAVEMVTEAFPGSVEVATLDEKQPYINWLRQLTERQPDAGPAVVAKLEAIGLRKSLSGAEWTTAELQQLATILRRAERATRTSSTYKQPAAAS